MNANPSVSLIFVNYQSARYLAAALESLFSFERKRDFFEVIVVNNDPIESEALRALEKSYHFHLMESGENSGFSRGNNLGAKLARGRILGFVNPDVLWIGTYLRGMVGAFDTNDQVGVLGMSLLDRQMKREAWSFGDEPSLTALLLNNLPSRRLAPESDEEIIFPDWVSGGALFVRRDLYEKIGGFDERFFLYFEDVDLCKEVRKCGFLVMRSAEFPLIHLCGKSQSSRRLQKKHFFHSQQKYFQKHRPPWEKEILGCLQFLFRKT